MFDGFGILSGRLYFSHNAPDNDWVIDKEEGALNGTTVRMQIVTRSPRTLRKVFDRFTSDPGAPAFDKTQVPVGLLCVGDENKEDFVS